MRARSNFKFFVMKCQCCNRWMAFAMQAMMIMWYLYVFLDFEEVAVLFVGDG